MIRVTRENHIHIMSRRNAPCAVIKPGDTIILEVWDSLEGRALEYYQNRVPYQEYKSRTNPATGPVYIEGALPGDVLDVRINKIKLWDHGCIVLEKYLLNKRNESSGNVYLKLDIIDGSIVYMGVRLPAEPMIGVIGTAPLKDRIVNDPGDHGGNMDTKIIAEGSRVLLPVFVEGALLAVGDIHAAMGEGELFYQGLEAGADVELTVNLIKGWNIKRPLVITQDAVACVASHRSIMTAQSQAIKDMGAYLTYIRGIGTEEACALIAFYGNLRFCQVAGSIKTIRLEILHKYINAFEEMNPFYYRAY